MRGDSSRMTLNRFRFLKAPYERRRTSNSQPSTIEFHKMELVVRIDLEEGSSLEYQTEPERSR